MKVKHHREGSFSVRGIRYRFVASQYDPDGEIRIWLERVQNDGSRVEVFADLSPEAAAVIGHELIRRASLRMEALAKALSPPSRAERDTSVTTEQNSTEQNKTVLLSGKSISES